MNTLGDKIHRLRKQAGFSQEELAFRVSVTRQTVSLWESNHLIPKSDKLKLLCEIFKVSSDYFLFDDEEKVTSERDNDAAVSDSAETESTGVKSDGTSTEKRKYKVVKIIAAALMAFVLLLITLICIMRLTTPTDGVGTVTSVSFYFDPKIMLSLLIVCIAIFIISIILLIISIIKARTK